MASIYFGNMKTSLSFILILLFTCATAQNDTTFTFVSEVYPEFPGGEQALFQFLQECQPSSDSLPSDCGPSAPTIYISMTITETGGAAEVDAMRKDDCGFWKHHVQCIGSMPDWTPGRLRGKATAMRYHIPIRIRLE